MKRKDFFLMGGICVLAGLLWLAANFLLPKENHTIRITVDGELFGEFSLDEDQEIAIGNTNICKIQDGEVRMIHADCPDQLCIHQRAVNAAGGSIVCLPNRVVIEAVTGTEVPEAENGIDAVV